MKTASQMIKVSLKVKTTCLRWKADDFSERMKGLEMTNQIWSLGRVRNGLWLLFCMGFFAGCSKYYSGEFVVMNSSEQKIRVIGMSEFGESEPRVGILPPNGKKGSVFGRLKSIPNSTHIRWRLESGSNTFTQTLDLQNVVPPNTPGETVFELAKDDKWTVRFVPESSSARQ